MRFEKCEKGVYAGEWPRDIGAQQGRGHAHQGWSITGDSERLDTCREVDA